ncbi:MAG: acetate--CoA ligase family protein [Elusimicrobia bacterium]|nr:acetate--CoA ligase family protein [Elusimicrobiota bacterium]
MKDIGKIEAVLDKAGLEKRKSLTEIEVYEILKIMALEVPEFLFYKMEDIEPEKAAAEILTKIKSSRIVIKIVSSETLHKTESGGVKIVAKAADEIEKTLLAMIKKFSKAGRFDGHSPSRHRREHSLEGIMICEFIEHANFSLGEELMIGARADASFGPIISFGVGGTNAEDLTKSLKTGLVPAIMPVALAHNRGVWEDFLSQSWIWRYCAGKVRGGKRLCADGEILKWFESFAYVMKYFSDNGSSAWAINEFEVNPLCVSRLCRVSSQGTMAIERPKGGIVALDGVLRFSEAKSMLPPMAGSRHRRDKNDERLKPSKKGIHGLLNPKNVAVVGVSEKKMNMARIILRNVISAGFDKKHIYIIKDFDGEIDGIKCYCDMKNLPETIDMCVVAVPSPYVPDVLKQAGDSLKINGIVLISGGMGEKEGSEDIAESVKKIIKEAKLKNPDFVLSGGNSLGIVLQNSKINTLFIPEYKLDYPLKENTNIAKTAFISQSGAFVISALSKMPWLKPVYSITVGNQQDITVVDYVEALSAEAEKDIKVLLVYIEGFKSMDGILLAKAIQKARKNGKTVIIYKAGRTAIGQKAVMGHTASIAGDYLVTMLILKKAGAIIADSFDDFSELALMACHFSTFSVKSPNTFFISNAGFETAGMADNIKGITAEIKDKNLGGEMDKILKKFKLDSIVDFKNPMDITPMASDDAIGEVVLKALNCDDFGGILLSMIPLTPQMNTFPASRLWRDDMEKSFLKVVSMEMKKLQKPVIFCVASGSLYDPYCDYAMSLGLPVFRSADRAVKVYAEYLENRTTE